MNGRTLFAIALGLLLAGCVQDTIGMRLTTEPSGARVSYRVVDAAAPARAITPWYDLGPTPIDREVAMHPQWSLPTSLLEFKLELPGFAPRTLQYEPARVLSDHRYLKDHVFLTQEPPPAPAPAPAPEQPPNAPR